MAGRETPQASGRRSDLDRRAVLAAAGGLLAAPLVARPAVAADVSERYLAARAELLAGRAVRSGGVTVEAPRLAESGNSVPFKVSVKSPMTATDHVRSIHILSEQNPIALIARFQFGPRSGRAEVATNIRLATTQNIHAIAELSDGTLVEGQAEIVVTLAACLDGT